MFTPFPEILLKEFTSFIDDWYTESEEYALLQRVLLAIYVQAENFREQANIIRTLSDDLEHCGTRGVGYLREREQLLGRIKQLEEAT